MFIHFSLWRMKASQKGKKVIMEWKWVRLSTWRQKRQRATPAATARNPGKSSGSDSGTGKSSTTKTESGHTPHQTKSLDISPPFNPFTLERWDLGTKIIKYKTKNLLLASSLFQNYVDFVLWVHHPSLVGVGGNYGESWPGTCITLVSLICSPNLYITY